MSTENNGEIEIDITQDPNASAGNEDINLGDSHESESDSDESAEKEKGEKSTSPSKKKPGKNKSNWNKMAEGKKAAEKKVADLQAKLDALESWSDESDDSDDDGYDEPSYEKSDLLEFIIENEDAKEYKEWIIEALDEFPGIDFNKALKLAKINWPEESESYEEFSTKSSQAVRTKKLKDLSREEAVANLSMEQFETWDNLNWKEQSNPFG